MARLLATNYADLDRLMGTRQVVRIGHNTTAERDVDEIIVRLHGHPIVSLQPDCVAQRDYVQVYHDGKGESPLDPYKWTTVTV